MSAPARFVWTEADFWCGLQPPEKEPPKQPTVFDRLRKAVLGKAKEK